ncbi:hypothetical protein H0X48_03250 [Candidatus Dependentiae bacterium]|nr:hypothetical protein [Candidatus Dependentiae bacterium]
MHRLWMRSRITFVAFFLCISCSIQSIFALSNCTCTITSKKDIPTDTNKLFISSNRLLADEVLFTSTDKASCSAECEKIKKHRQDIWGIKNAHTVIDFKAKTGT